MQGRQDLLAAFVPLAQSLLNGRHKLLKDVIFFQSSHEMSFLGIAVEPK